MEETETSLEEKPKAEDCPRRWFTVELLKRKRIEFS